MRRIRNIPPFIVNELGKIRQLFTGEHRGFFIFASAVTAVAFLILAFGPGNNICRWIQARFEIASQRKQIRQYGSEIEEMERRIDMLRSDRDTLEKFAREQYLMKKKDEDIFIMGE